MYLPGTILLWISLALGLLSTFAYLRSLDENSQLRAVAQQSYVLMTAAVVLASSLLLYLLLTHDYRLAYVYAYSDNSLPMRYLISSFWGGQEGSFLLWVLAGSILGLPLYRLSKAYESRVMVFFNLTLVSLLLLLLKQNPFRFHPGLAPGMIPTDGAGLNPLLQNPWMVIHPPVMFLGYAAMGIPFAFAMAALWMKRYDDWTRASMSWLIFSVLSLGAAIMLGAYWSYKTLGWGGYWGWDPVENASLVPWLVAVAMLHTFILQRNRDRFRRLNLFLAILGYLLVIYATFLTRSGVLADFSVHSFVDLGISGYLIFNMIFFILISLGMLIWRWREIPAEGGEEPFFSRTIFLVLATVMLLLIAVVVFFGTSAPLITRLWMEKPAQVGPDFYNHLGYWLAIALSLILGLTPFLKWVGAKTKIAPVAVGSLILTLLIVAVSFALGLRDWRAQLYLAAAAFALITNTWHAFDKIRRSSWLRIGGDLSHIGLALMIIAFMTSGWLGLATKIRLQQGEATDVLGYEMIFQGVDKPTPTARDAMVIDIRSASGNEFTLRPLMWVNEKSNQLVANPGIRERLRTDLYIAPIEYHPAEQAPLSGQLILDKGQAAKFRDWSLLFTGFDLGQQHSTQASMKVGMTIEITRPGEAPMTLEPSLMSTPQGLQPTAVAIPGKPGASIVATGMSVDSGKIRIELRGLGGGVGRQKVLRKGESLEYKGMKIRFENFDLSNFEPQAGKIEFGVVCAVERDGRKDIVVPRYDQRLGEGGITPAAIPDSEGLTLSIGRVSAEDGAVQLKVFDPTLPPRQPAPANLVVDVSTKPWISLIWIGSLLAVLGLGLSIYQHRRELSGLPVES